MEHDVCLLSRLWLCNRAISGGGDIGCILHWQVATWTGPWGQVAEEEVYLPREVYRRATYFLLPRLCGGRQHGGKAFGAADAPMSAVGVVLDGGMRPLEHTLRTLAITYSRRAAVEGEKGPG